MRFTKNIRKKQDYCEFELIRCRYQDIYGFKKYKEIEEYADCDLTLAIDKLGELEDIEEELGIDLITLFKALKDGIYRLRGSGKVEYMPNDEFWISPQGCGLCYGCAQDPCELFFYNYGKKCEGGWALNRKELL